MKRRAGAAILIALAFAGGTLAGCSSTEGETCDGGPSPATADEAIRGLIAAAQTQDPGQACKFATNSVTDEQMVDALADLSKQLDQLNVDAHSALIREGEQGGSLIPAEVYGPTGPETPIELDVLSIRDEGYRVFFP